MGLKDNLDFTDMGVENKHSVCKRQDSVMVKCLKMELNTPLPEFRLFPTVEALVSLPNLLNYFLQKWG